MSIIFDAAIGGFLLHASLLAAAEGDSGWAATIAIAGVVSLVLAAFGARRRA